MWTKVIPILNIVIQVIRCELTAPGIDRSVSDGVKSIGFNLIYGDEDIQIINEVVKDEEKMNALKSKINLNEALPPLPAEDVKCLMSVDRFCSKPMREIKSVLIEALKDDCAKCSSDQRESAGKVVAAMMAHDPVAWKVFLTRSALVLLPKKKAPREERHKYKIIGPPEYVENKRNRFIMPGVRVRVKRYVAQQIN